MDNDELILTLTGNLPPLVDPDTLVASQGLCHLNFHQPSGESLHNLISFVMLSIQLLIEYNSNYLQN